jgi:uncharacterized protein YbaR (Trm112 family)
LTVPFDKVSSQQDLRGETHLAISQELLDILVCPVCKNPVKMLPDGTGLKCQQCKRVYPVRDDIPVMLPEEARIVSD